MLASKSYIALISKDSQFNSSTYDFLQFKIHMAKKVEELNLKNKFSKLLAQLLMT